MIYPILLERRPFSVIGVTVAPTATCRCQDRERWPCRQGARQAVRRVHFILEGNDFSFPPTDGES